MADAKISELTALTAAADADLFAIVDSSATETKKITRQNLLGSIVISGANVGIGVASPTTTLDVNGFITARASGGEGGQLNLSNPDNLSTGLTVDVSAADTGRIWQARPNSLMQIGQIASTGGTVALYTAAAQRLTINAAGNIGINQASPTAKLDVNGSLKLNAGNHATGVGTFAMGNHAGTNYTASTSYSVAVGNEAARYSTANNNVGIGSHALRGASGSSTGGTNIAIGTNAGTSITSGSASVLAGHLAGHVITTGIGNVILGTGSAPALVNGNNNVCIGNSVATALSSGSLNVFLGVNAGDTTTSGSNCIIVGNGSAASSATVSNEITLGNASISALRCQVTSITALSDMRDKTDITDLDLGLDYINALRPVEFVWAMRDAEDDNPRQGTKEAGFIAQELRSAEDQFDACWLGTVLDTNPDRLEASPGKLLPIVIKALQEASAKIDELIDRIATLEGN